MPKGSPIIDNENKENQISASENNPPADSPADWRDHLERAQRQLRRDQEQRAYRRPPPIKNSNMRVGSYAVDLERSLEKGQIYLNLYTQERLKVGLGGLKPAELTHSKIELYEDPNEREFLWDLLGRTEAITSFHGSSSYLPKVSSTFLTPGHADAILRKISQSEKLFRNKSKSSRAYGAFEKDEIQAFTYDFESWNFQLKLTPEGEGYQLEGELRRDESTVLSVSEVRGAMENFVFFQDSMARSDLMSYPMWYELIRRRPLFIAASEIEAFLDYFWSESTICPTLELPDQIQFTEKQDVIPQVQLSFALEKDSGFFGVKLSFNYQGKIVRVNSGRFVYFMASREKIIRDLEMEKQCLDQLLELAPNPSENPSVQGSFSSAQLLPTVEKAMALGWQVLAREQKVKMGGDFKIDVTSGVDWFDVQAEFQFGTETLRLPQLLQALRSGQRMINLSDGSTGLLPEQWLKRFAPLLGIAKATESGVRLSKVQALFFSASLEDNEKFHSDKKFSSLKKIILDLQSLKPLDADKKMQGKLRGYQKQGLAWLSLISEHQIGGVLADDMGLGKTIQILALLSKAAANKDKKAHLPSLVVAPKSLVFNWKNELEKFTPHLKVLTYTGSGRQALWKDIANQDLILTTYQTLRIDIESFKNQRFNFLILDEAHYIKNSRSQITMAARLVQADKKLALTGTPIENSMMDLFSVLSVVTPGLVTEAQALRWVRESEPENIQRLAKALSPFLLRRTKDQVLKDLPKKTEQILYCELSEPERKKYNELKAYYWTQLSGKIEEKGISKSKIDVLEALLRLRQAACHQGLLDQGKTQTTSSKFELVLEQLDTVIKDGHKALIFSQFTSLLELFSQELIRRKIKFEYLDGKTVDRAQRVANFQSDTECPVFLLSLKAGGVGLNLTAADYVFILDPWWNPAAEAQAIDRSHRIGQTKKVFAYKVIAKDTVEEKILALQEKKKQIAKSIISDDASVLKSLKFEDLHDLFA